MFEAFFRIVALVESDEQGQCLFKVFKHREPASRDAFSSLVTTVYQQEVYRMLQAGDTLTVAVHLNLSRREIEKTMRFREDGHFEGDGVKVPTPDLLPIISAMYEQLSQQALGDVLTITFRVQRL